MGEKQGFLPFPKSFDTICIHNSIDPHQWKSKSIIPHIVPSTVFKIEDPRQPRKFTYSRFGNPNRTILEKTVAAINKGKYGICFASGISSLMAVLGLVKSGEHLICCDDVSPEAFEVFNNIGANYGIRSTFLDVNNTEELCSCIENNTKKFTYSRSGNPNRSILEKTVAAINKGKYGICFASGASSLMAVLGLVKFGEHLICCDDVSPETSEVFNNIGASYGIRSTFVDVNNTEKLCSCIENNTKLIWIENPSNTALKITDICEVAQVAKEKQVLLGVDNTFLTPYLQRPLDLGADIVMQSATKYVNGHSDIILGCLCTNKSDVYKDLVLMQVAAGLNPSPFDCYQTLRGIKTLNLRMDQHLKNSVILANYLGQHSAVEKVIHPGLKSHPQHDIFKLQASGHSGIISFYLKGGPEKSEQLLKALKVFTITEVSGCGESTAQIPFSMSHKHWNKNKKKRLNITENLVKLSVGLESICDLILDIESALDSLKSNSKCQEN